MKIYTKRGDQGHTTLFGGESVGKDDARIEALGTVDELVAAIGLAKSELDAGAIQDRLARLQSELYRLLAEIGGAGASMSPRIGGEHLAAMERGIDDLDAALPPLRAFIIPGQCRASAALHLARAICRRAERRVVALAPAGAPRPVVISYLNRLSDLLFVMARFVDQAAGLSDQTFHTDP